MAMLRRTAVRVRVALSLSVFPFCAISLCSLSLSLQIVTCVFGALVMDAYKTFRLNEVAPNVTNTHFIASPMAILMNKRTYNALPDADKAVIDDMSGRATAEWIANIIDTTDADLEKAFRDAGEVNFIDLTDEEKAAWDATFASAADAWANAQADSDGAMKALTSAREVAAN